MPMTLQPVLACGGSVASDITVFHSRSGTVYEVYIGLALLERFGTAPEVLQRKMLVGRLHNLGASLRELGEKFGHDSRTIKRWGAALLSTDVEELGRAFAGRGSHRKLTPELIRYARQLYRERHMLGRNYRQIIIAKVQEVFQVRISTTVASGIFRIEEQAAEGLPTREKVATDIQMEAPCPVELPLSVKHSPTPLPAQCVDSQGASVQFIHHAGQALFAGQMKGFSDPLQRQFLGQILQGAVNVEQSKNLCGRSLAHFTGPVISGLKEQRDGLDRQAGIEAVLDVFERNNELLADGPNRGDLFYFDPHTKEYTGQLKLIKGWCGRRHGPTKVMNLDSFHTRSGRPCFVQHYSAYYDLRERFFMSLELFDRLFAPEHRQGRTFVIDRAIYGLAALQSFDWDHVITWEKNYSGGGWNEGAPTVSFTRSRTKNHSGDHKFVRFQCQQSAWKRDPSFRRIIARVSRERRPDIEVSILTNHPNMDIEDVVWAIFRRWVQENDFKYLDGHFGFNQLTSRDYLRFSEQTDRFQDRPVDSPDYRELKDALHTLESRLGRQLVQLRRCQKEGRDLELEQAKLMGRMAAIEPSMATLSEQVCEDQPPPPHSTKGIEEAAELQAQRRRSTNKIRANADRQAKLQAQITGLETEIAPLEGRLCQAVRKQSRLQMLIDGDYRLLDARKKSMMDALRITASNMFRNVQEQFRAIYDNFRDDHVLVRLLSRCSGYMSRTSQTVVFTLWLPGALQPHCVRAFDALLKQIQQQINSEITGSRSISLKLVVGPLNVPNDR